MTTLHLQILRGQAGPSDDAKAQVVASWLSLWLIFKQLARFRIHDDTVHNHVVGARRFRRPVHRKAAGCVPSAGGGLAAVLIFRQSAISLRKWFDGSCVG